MDHHPVVNQIEEILKKNNFWYEKFVHEPVRTSAEAASVRDGYTTSQGAKALIVRLKRNGKKDFVMFVVPGDKKFDSKKAKEVTGAKDIRFATKEEVSDITEGIVPGGVPPMGNLFEIEVFADESVFLNDKVIFNAGDKRVSIGMKSKDYKEEVNPHIVEIV